jgi:hypothetical protein
MRRSGAPCSTRVACTQPSAPHGRALRQGSLRPGEVPPPGAREISPLVRHRAPLMADRWMVRAFEDAVSGHESGNPGVALKVGGSTTQASDRVRRDRPQSRLAQCRHHGSEGLQTAWVLERRAVSDHAAHPGADHSRRANVRGVEQGVLLLPFQAGTMTSSARGCV